MKSVYSPKNFEKTAKPIEIATWILFFASAGIACAYIIMAVISIFKPYMLNQWDLTINPITEKLELEYIIQIPFYSHRFPYKLNLPGYKEIIIQVTYILLVSRFVYISSILFVMNRIIKRAIRKEPFSRENAFWIRSIAVVLLVIMVIKMVTNFILQPPFSIWYILTNIGWEIILPVVLLFILADLFKYGSILQRNYDETL